MLNKEYMLNYAHKRIVELQNDLTDPVFDQWKEELKIDLMRWKLFVKEFEVKSEN